MRAMPVDRLGWHRFYARRYHSHPTTQCEHLAIWYLVLHLAFDEVAT